MQSFSVLGQTIELPARLLLRGPTESEASWLQFTYLTVQLTDHLETLRVHTSGREFIGRPSSFEQPETWNPQKSTWLLIGDVILNQGDLADSRALPVDIPFRPIAFTHTTLVRLNPAARMNIGLAAKVKGYGGRGGGFQAELLPGQAAATFSPFHGKIWHGKSARA